MSCTESNSTKTVTTECFCFVDYEGSTPKDPILNPEDQQLMVIPIICNRDTLLVTKPVNEVNEVLNCILVRN